MTYEWYGDLDIRQGGMYLDLSELENGGDYVPCVKITNLDSACGFTGAILIENGSIYISDKPNYRERALSVIGVDESEKKATPLELAEAFDAYWGVESDSYSGPLVVQTIPGESMTFEGWQADIRKNFKSEKGLREWIESEYGCKP